MRRFYIKQISVSGEKVEYSSVNFKDGVNIIYGPSNTGKSYVINCINYMFGSSDIPFTKDSTGYDTICMTMESDDGYSISMTRKIVDGKNGEAAGGTVEVSSNVPDIESEEYSISKGEYNDLLLKLIGINKRHNIIATEKYDIQKLTIRQMIHLFFIDEENIFRKGTVFDAPKYKKINASLSIINFLLSDDDLMHMVPEKTPDEIEREETQRTGVIVYLNKKIEELMRRKDEIETAIAEAGDIDIEGKIEEIISELDDVETEIVNSTTESKNLLKQIFEISKKLEEARFLQDRYASLKTQYSADIKRLRFIKNGELKSDSVAKLVKCPFCDHEMEKDNAVVESYAEASDAELTRIELQMGDLKEATSGIDSKIHTMENEIASLNQRHEEITLVINRELRPQASGLRDRLEAYKRILEAQRELYAIDAMATELNTDAFEKENGEESTKYKFDGRSIIDKDVWKALSDSINDMIKECGYPKQPESRISIDTVDVVVGGKFKKDQGKGYRAFLNTIMLFNLMKYLERAAKYAPHLLILDSPILSLKEKKYKISEKEKATPGMRESLFKYMIGHCGNNQIIIAENEIPEGVNYSNVKLIEFSDGETDSGGFLKSVKE